MTTLERSAQTESRDLAPSELPLRGRVIRFRGFSVRLDLRAVAGCAGGSEIRTRDTASTRWVHGAMNVTSRIRITPRSGRDSVQDSNQRNLAGMRPWTKSRAR